MKMISILYCLKKPTDHGDIQSSHVKLRTGWSSRENEIKSFSGFWLFSFSQKILLLLLLLSP